MKTFASSVKPATSTKMDTTKIRQGAYVSLSVSALLLIVKFIAYYLTHSQAIFSDALESIVNVVAASLALFVIYISSKPADRDHPYGHGKAEYFSSTVEGALISFAAVMIGIESVNALVSGQSISRIDTGLALIVAAGVANAMLGLYLVNIGKKNQSAALVASGKHVLSDFYTSAAVIVGLGAVRLTGIREFDAIAALVVAAVLAFTGFRLVRDSVHALMDAEDSALVDRIAKAFTENRRPGIIRIHHTRVIRAGNYHHIDAHVVVPEFWSVSTAHEQTAQFEADVIANHDHQGEIHFHIDPCRRVYCHACDLEDCKIRREPFAASIPFSFAELTSPTEPEELQHPESPGTSRA